MPSVLILMCGAFLISSPLSPFPTIAFSFRFSYTVYRAFTVFSGFFHQIIRIIGSMKATIEAIRLPIESHSGKSGCRSSKLSRYPGLSFSKFLISFRVNMRSVEMIVIFFFLFHWILLFPLSLWNFFGSTMKGCFNSFLDSV